jgi:acetamidase/formamidase
MITKKKVTVKNKALAAVLGVKPGAVVKVECKRGVPTSKEWRNRFSDSEIDGCILIHQTSTKSIKSTKTPGGDK